MVKPLIIISVIVSGLVFTGLGAGPWRALGLISGPEEFIQGSDRPRHRLVATMVCNESTKTFLSVMSLRRTRPNPAEISVTDAFVTPATDALVIPATDAFAPQFWVAAVVQPDRPLRLTCEDVPEEFSKDVPVVVHLDSRYPTSGILMHISGESPDAEWGTEDLNSLRLL